VKVQVKGQCKGFPRPFGLRFPLLDCREDGTPDRERAREAGGGRVAVSVDMSRAPGADADQAEGKCRCFAWFWRNERRESLRMTSRYLVRAGLLCVLLARMTPAHGQEARWSQLEQQAKQLVTQGNDGAALPVAQQAAQVAQATWGAQDPHLGLSLDTLGNIEFDLGNYSDAERALRVALAIDLKALGATNIETARVMADLGELYGSHGQFGQADQLFHDAIPVYLKTYGQVDERVADLVFRASDVLLSEAHYAGSFSEAESKYNAATNGFTLAAAVYQKAKGDASTGLAHCYDRLASIAEDGGRHDVAEKLHKRALDILEKADGPDSMQLTDSLEGLARVYKDEQQPAEAEPIYQRVLKIEQAHLRADDPGLRDAEADLAGLYSVWGKPAQAEPYFRQYLGNLMDEFRANAATMSERDRLIYFSAEHNAYPLFFSFVLKYHDQMPELAGEMYDDLLEEKGLIAESAAAMRAAIVASGDTEAVAMLDKLASDKAQLAALAESTASAQPGSGHEAARLMQEANALEQSLMKRSAAMSRQKTQNAATWRDVQKALKPGESAVEVIRFQYETGAQVFGNQIYVALVVTPASKEPALVVLGEAKDLEAGPMMAYRDNVGQTRGFAAEETPAVAGQQGNVANTQAAYAAFWKPLEPALGNARRVYFAGDGVLDTIPVGLMADSDGKLLMEKVQLRIVNSTKDLLPAARVAQSKSALLVGNPKFDLTAAQQKMAIAELRKGRDQGTSVPAAASAGKNGAADGEVASRGGDLKGGDLNPLPGTQVEVDTVDKLLKAAGWQPAEYTGDLALKDAVTQAHGPRLVHVATHGFFLTDEELTANAAAQGKQANLSEDPMLRAGLFFAGADRVREGAAPAAGVDDGVLTAFEASQLNLEGTELVVLSACETGLGKELNSDGVFGLRRGLQEAGADAVMMSMWSVPDKETQELMTLFYAKWLGGMEKPEALRQAQLEQRETVKKRYGKDLPFYWGAFVLVGR
jgi:CHAT domain-containing protein